MSVTRTAALATCAALTAIAASAVGGPAHAEQFNHRDARGDVKLAAGDDISPAPGEKRSEVLAVRADYGPNRLRVVLRGADITERTGGGVVSIDTAGDELAAWQPVSPKSPAWFLYSENDPDFTCKGVIHRADRTADRVLVSIPTRCLRSPWVRVGAALVSGNLAGDRIFVDDALRKGLEAGDEDFAYSPRIRRG